MFFTKLICIKSTGVLSALLQRCKKCGPYSDTNYDSVPVDPDTMPLSSTNSTLEETEVLTIEDLESMSMQSINDANRCLEAAKYRKEIGDTNGESVLSSSAKYYTDRAKLVERTTIWAKEKTIKDAMDDL